MGIWLIFQNRRLMRCGDGEGYAGRVLDVPVKCVGGSFRQIRRVNAEARDHGELALQKLQIPRFQEKPLSFSQTRPYRKPTQVGRMKILRRLRELRRRNSAN
jgi:hypothetical protein